MYASLSRRGIAAVARETFKPAASRKTYLVDTYVKLLRQSPVLLVLHNNTLKKAENAELRQNIVKAGGRLTVINHSLFKVAIRGLDSPDPASIDAKKFRWNKHPLMDLLSGPTAVITVSELDPKAVADIVKLIDRTSERMILLGGRVDGSVLSRPQIDQFKDLPSLPEMHAQLAGVLTILGGAGLVQTLESSSNVLYLTLDARRKDMEGPPATSSGDAPVSEQQ
jgi:large subunit ribosomal protein L10